MRHHSHFPHPVLDSERARGSGCHLVSLRESWRSSSDLEESQGSVETMAGNREESAEGVQTSPKQRK